MKFVGFCNGDGVVIRVADRKVRGAGNIFKIFLFYLKPILFTVISYDVVFNRIYNSTRIFIKFFFFCLVAKTGMIYISHTYVYESTSGGGVLRTRETYGMVYYTHGNGIPGRNKQCRRRAEPTVYNNNGLHGNRHTSKTRYTTGQTRERDDDNDNNNPIARTTAASGTNVSVVYIC